MKEISFPESELSRDAASFLACLASILELPAEQLPMPSRHEDAATGWTVSRWLSGLGLGLVPIAEPATFSWAGPWIARIRLPDGNRRSVVMYGVPSGVIWDPAGEGEIDPVWIETGFVVAATDIALAMPPRSAAPLSSGVVTGIFVAPAKGEPAQQVEKVRAISGQGLAGDRHVAGTGTFPSGLPGSALTLIEAEVCDTFEPPLGPDEHRRNIVTRGIDLNGLVGRVFTIGAVCCRGMRLCEPCKVVQHYADRPVLRDLVHRGGLRADILEDGEIKVGDEVRLVGMSLRPEGNEAASSLSRSV